MCGKENVTQSPFCLNCGANLAKSESPAPVTDNKDYQLPPVQPQMQYAQPRPQPAAYAPAPKKPVNKKLIGIIAGAVAAFFIVSIAVIIAVVNGSKVSINDYIADEISFSGLNGYATADYSQVVDFYGLELALRDAEALDYENMTEEELYEAFYDEFYNSYYDSSNITDFVDVECMTENNGSLSNGDEVEIRITVNKEAINNYKAYGKKINSKETITKKYKVSGLADPIVIDVLAGIESVDVVETASSSYNGITKRTSFEFVIKDEYAEGKVVGDYKVVITYSYGSVNYAVYTALDNEYLFNGRIMDAYDDDSEFDTASATVACQLVQNGDPTYYGFVCEPSSAEITARKRSNIIRSADDISDESFNLLKNKAVTYAREELGEEFTLDSAFIGYASSGSRAGYNGVSFLFTNGEVYRNVYYEKLSVYSDGTVYGAEEASPYSSWSSYQSIADFKEGFEEGYTFYEKDV